jgi:hypothetical protein
MNSGVPPIPNSNPNSNPNPNLGVTGNFYQSDIENFMDAGVDRVLAKPLVMSYFDDAVRG